MAIDALVNDFTLAHKEAYLFAENYAMLKNAIEIHLGLSVLPCDGGYFLLADISSTEFADGMEFAQWLAEDRKIACVPLQPFVEEDKERFRPLVRFSICKTRALIEKACRHLAGDFS